MIITRSPLRISLGGGGTDLPSYYRKHSGFLISAAIDRYVYITLHQTFVPDLIVKYSKLETVKCLRCVGSENELCELKCGVTINTSAPFLQTRCTSDMALMASSKCSMMCDM